MAMSMSERLKDVLRYSLVFFLGGFAATVLLPDFAYRSRFRLVDFITKEMTSNEKQYYDGEDCTSSYAWPADMDRNNHMNNARFIRELNFKRRHLFFRLGIWPILIKRGVNLIVHSQTIRYRKEIKLGDHYKVRAKIIGYHDKEHSFYVESRFENHAGFVLAIHVCKYRMVLAQNKKGTVNEENDQASFWSILPFFKKRDTDNDDNNGTDSMIPLPSDVLRQCGLGTQKGIADVSVPGKDPFIDAWNKANAISSKALFPTKDKEAL